MDFIQDYFIKMFMPPLNQNINKSELALETVCKILNKNKEEVKEEEIALLEHLFYTSTMHFNGRRMNNITDADYRTRVRNMYQYLSLGASLEEAMEKSWEPLYEVEKDASILDDNNKIFHKMDSVDKLYEVENKQELSKLGAFKKKYPFLFDEAGNLKPEACDMLDALIQQNAPQFDDKKTIESNIRK